MATSSDLTGLDPAIAPMVRVLRSAGVPTDESCEGGDGHAFSEPTISFRGDYQEGLAALALALRYQHECRLRVSELRRTWRMDDGELQGPWWNLTFVRL
jgi:hypothetical protein